MRSIVALVALAATTDSASRFQEFVVQKNELPDRRQAEIVWFAKTDAGGRFKFEDLPAGEYFLASPVAWSPSGSSRGANQEVAYAHLTLGAGQQAEITVTRPIAGPVSSTAQ